MGEDQALEQLRAILAQSQYQSDRSVPWWQQLLAPVFDLAWRLLGQFAQLVLDSTSGRQGALGVVLFGVSALVLVLAVAYLARAVRLSVVSEARLQGASLAERRERSDELWRNAQRKAAAGELGEALQLAYLSALYALDERALVHVEINLTNREHAQRLAQHYPALADSFSGLVEGYERVRYGRATVAPETFKNFSERAQCVRAAALSGAAA
ncbi:MAG TPA: DUF4129 domain-containing protein [Chloroflexota bacterium]|jgi:hypothetical protein